MTYALEQEDSLLNKGLNNSFLNYKGCFSSEFKIPFHRFVSRQNKLFQMMVSERFLKQCEAEAFLKFNSCFSTEFGR